MYSIPGVEFVNILLTFETDLETGSRPRSRPTAKSLLAGDELIASGRTSSRRATASEVSGTGDKGSHGETGDNGESRSSAT